MASKINRMSLFVKKWMLPIGIFDIIKYHLRALESRVKYSKNLIKNNGLKNEHYGKRCFIVGNSPSIANIEVEKLRGEYVFSISNGYHHPKYSYFKPSYHIVPGLTYTSIKGGMNTKTAVSWFKEMDEKLGPAKLILSVEQALLVEKNKLFNKREVYYMDASGRDYVNVDLSKPIGEIQSAPQIAIQVAIYMGFREIYLLGVDHDSLCSNKYDYFFNAKKVMKFKDQGVDEDRNIVDSFYKRLLVHERLFRIYEFLAESAIVNKVKVVNLSRESMVDCFEKDNLDKILK
jgi:hypothetical protein